ncbi:MAG TPA: hypothetical protein VE444_10640 [Gaiellaceae bacterium]|nr:hypothetical protein [Gaiellaceae bacterium]
MGVEYAGIVAGIALLAATLTGAYGQSVTAVFANGTAGVAAAAKAAKAQKVSPAGAKTAYTRAPYKKPVLKYLYALGWIGGTKNAGQCGLTLLGQGAAKDQAARELRANAKLVAQLKRRGVSVSAAANALTSGVVLACA